MGGKVALLACKNLRGEMSAILGSEGIEDVAAVYFPGNCYGPRMGWDTLERLIPAGDCGTLNLIAGPCCAGIGGPPESLGNCRVHAVKHCCNLFIDNRACDSYVSDGLRLMLPGELMQWRIALDKRVCDHEKALDLLDRPTSLALIDTGVDAASSAHLHSLAAFVDLPCRVIPAGLDHLRLFLESIVLKWRLDSERDGSRGAVAVANRQSAEYAMVADLIANLATVMTEREAAEAIFDVFTTLFAPSSLVYVSLLEGRPARIFARPTTTTDDGPGVKRLIELAEESAWTESGKGFRLRVAHHGETLSVLEIDGVTFPAYKEHYLNLARTVGKVCGLAISNARKYEQIKRAEELLATERNRLAVTLDSIGDGVIATDRDGRVVLINRVAEKLTGWGQAEAAGRPLNDVFHIINEKTRQICENPVVKVLESGAIVGLANDTALVARDGSERIIADSAAPITDERGTVLGVVLVFRDVTEPKRAEEDRERLLLELERRAAELDTANKELESFAYSVSHDLRAPLRHIDGFSLALLEDHADKLDARGKEYLQFVRKASQNMAQLIDALLSLSRVTRSELRRVSVDLSAIARELAAEHQSEQPERRAEFIIAPQVVVSGDPHLLRIVLENLIGNAWKFTSGQGHARIAFGITREKGEEVYYVRDNGAGFDMAYADKLFGPFQRLHKAEEFPGTGVGLATVQRIVHRHGGRIWAEGKVDEGATFYFTLG